MSQATLQWIIYNLQWDHFFSHGIIAILGDQGSLVTEIWGSEKKGHPFEIFHEPFERFGYLFEIFDKPFERFAYPFEIFHEPFEWFGYPFGILNYPFERSVEPVSNGLVTRL